MKSYSKIPVMLGRVRELFDYAQDKIRIICPKSKKPADGRPSISSDRASDASSGRASDVSSTGVTSPGHEHETGGLASAI